MREYGIVWFIFALLWQTTLRGVCKSASRKRQMYLYVVSDECEVTKGGGETRCSRELTKAS